MGEELPPVELRPSLGYLLPIPGVVLDEVVNPFLCELTGVSPAISRRATPSASTRYAVIPRVVVMRRPGNRDCTFFRVPPVAGGAGED
jgi:hypothetical protein